MLSNLFTLLQNPVVLLIVGVLVVMNWDRIKPFIDKLRGVTEAKPNPSALDSIDNVRSIMRETLDDWLDGNTRGDVQASAVGDDGPLEGFTAQEHALDAAVHNWLMLRRGSSNPAKLDELFASFPETYLSPPKA